MPLIRWGDDAQLLHHAQSVIFGPVFRNFAISDATYSEAGYLHLVTAAIFFYVSFARASAREIRYVVGGIGLLYLLSGVFVVVGLLLYDLSFEAYELVYNLMRAAFGAFSIFVARFLGCADDYSEWS